MKKRYTLFFALVLTSFSYSQIPNFYDKCYNIPLPPNTWNSVGSSDSALYVVGNSGACFIFYHHGGMKCIYTGTTNNLTGVQFLNNSVGYVWGDQGTLLKTSNGGNTWLTVPTNTTSTFDKLEVIDENTIFYWAGSIVKKTIDGGANWTPITLPTSLSVSGMHFFNSQNGQISFKQSGSLLGELYETINGGTAWNQLFTLNNYSFEKLYYVTDSIGYIYGFSPFSLYKTTDKGLTWNMYFANPMWALHSEIVSYNNEPTWIEANQGSQSWVSVLGGAGEALGAVDIHSFNYHGTDILYVLTTNGLYRYMTGGPSYQGLSFFNGVTANTSNPTNTLLPGSKVRFKVSVKNNLTTNLLTLSGKIRCNSPYITITDSVGTYNNVLTNTTAWSADEFEMQLAANIPDNYVPQFELILVDQIQTGDPWITMFSFPIVFNPFSVNFNIIDDDNIPDSNGDNDDIAEPGETIEIIPLADNITQHTFGNMEGYLFSPLPEIKVWADTMGSTAIVYNHYPYGIITASTQPSEDFVFTNNFTSTYNLLFSMVFTGSITSFKVDGNFNGYIPIDSTIIFRWATGFSMNGGFPNIPTLIEEEENSYGCIHAYPNPTNGIVSIKHQNMHQQMNVEVYNMLGEKVLQQQNTNEINLSASPKGVYFVRIYDNKKSYTTKISVE